MQEFSSVTASSYDADALAPLLSEKSADGWDVVSIVSAGTNIVAYLRREASGDTVTDETDEGADTAFVPVPVEEPVVEEPAEEPVAEEPAVEEPVVEEIAAEQPAAEPVDEPAGWGTAPEDDRAGARAGRGARGGRAGRGRTRTGRVRGSCRLVRRSVGSLRAALLGRQRLDRARVACRSAVHRSPGRLTGS